MNTIYDVDIISNGYFDSKEFKNYTRLVERMVTEKPLTLREVRAKLGELEIPRWTSATTAGSQRSVQRTRYRTGHLSS